MRRVMSQKYIVHDHIASLTSAWACIYIVNYKIANDINYQRSRTMSVDAKYKTTATATGGGRDGKTALADGTMPSISWCRKNSAVPAARAPIPKNCSRSAIRPASSARCASARRQTKIKLPRRLDRHGDHRHRPAFGRRIRHHRRTRRLSAGPARGGCEKARRRDPRHLPVFQRHQGERGCEDDHARVRGFYNFLFK